VRAIVWLGLGILALNVLLVGAVASVGLIRRFQLSRTSRQLERLGFVVRLPYAPESRPIWPGWVVVLGGSVALIVTTAVLTGPPSARTLAEPAASFFLPASANVDTVVPPEEKPGAGHPAPVDTAASNGAADPAASEASSTSTAQPPVDATGSDAGAPSSVAAKSTSATTIHLEWAAVRGAAGYEVERSTDQVAWKAVASRVAQTAYTDAALTAGTTYYYRVAAFVNGQEAPASDAVSATTAADTSTPPVLISATGSVGSIQLAWTGVDGATGYSIERSLDGSTGWTQIGTTGQIVTDYTDTGLSAATSYFYRVIAETSEGDSPPSKILSASTTPDGPSTSNTSDVAP
jgi:fibronectin type III domain protein